MGCSCEGLEIPGDGERNGDQPNTEHKLSRETIRMHPKKKKSY